MGNTQHVKANESSSWVAADKQNSVLEEVLNYLTA